MGGFYYICSDNICFFALKFSKDGDRMSEIENILKQIGELREKLHKLAEGKRFTDPDPDPEVLVISQMLDVMLNEYKRFLKDKIECIKNKS
jgi:hypothetical protein